MEIKKEKLFSLLLATIIIATFIFTPQFSTEKKKISDGFLYEINEGSAVIKGYTGFETDVKVPESIENCPVTKICDGAFADCIGIVNITIPKSVTEIGDFPFAGCSALESISVDKANEIYYSVGNCLIEKVSNILISGCKSSVIPETVSKIEASAFEGCIGLKSIVIPESVTEIGDKAFFECSHLSVCYYPGDEASWENIDFSSDNECLTDATIHFGTLLEFAENGVKVYASENVINYGTELRVSEKSFSDITIDKTKGYNLDNAVSYEILFIKEGENVNPDGFVTMSMLVPSDMKTGICKVVLINSDGTVENMGAVYKNGFLEFVTDKPGWYAIVEDYTGDVTGDGKVNMSDAVAIRRNIINSELYPLTLNDVGDVNGDGKFNMADAVAIRRYIVNSEAFPFVN